MLLNSIVPDVSHFDVCLNEIVWANLCVYDGLILIQYLCLRH